MASEITHIVLTELIFDRFFLHVSKQTFMTGVLFPDIRCLGTVHRDKTHLFAKSLKEVQTEKNAFIAGMKFHQLTDLARRDFMLDKNIYQYIPETNYVESSLKFFEDELYYARCRAYPEVISFLETIQDEERQFGMDDRLLIHWHHALKDYIAIAPSDYSRDLFIQALRFTKKDAEEINDIIDLIRPQKEVTRILDEFYQKFSDVIMGYESNV
jgi:hypothetical protein